MEQKNRGGKREGAGRKPPKEKKKSYTFYLSESMAIEVKKLLDKLRNNA